ncbi:MAG TPA: carotenoid biosynthesis protein [Terracidiphilus sp.]|nr:carotenoid biosynthesis protein [Terracidiphilus sp.]
MHRPAASARSFTIALSVIFLAYATARMLEIAQPPISRTAIVALDVLSAMAFALVDGARRYGLHGILVFAGICAVVGNVVENIGVVTGFPFGHYYFVGLMGPKLFHVPVLLGLAYIGMAYVSWVLACAIAGSRWIATPFLAAFIMTAWDLAQDPVWATVLHGWVWRDGGAWFGVPLTNYLGWLGTVFLIYVLFATYLRRQPKAVGARASVFSAVLFYSLCAAGNVAQCISHATPVLAADPTGKLWRVEDILHASALVSVFVMGTFAVLAWARTRKRSSRLSPAEATD